MGIILGGQGGMVAYGGQKLVEAEETQKAKAIEDQQTKLDKELADRKKAEQEAEARIAQKYNARRNMGGQMRPMAERSTLLSPTSSPSQGFQRKTLLGQ